MFRDAYTDAWTNGRTGQKQYASGHTTLGGDIKASDTTYVEPKVYDDDDDDDDDDNIKT